MNDQWIDAAYDDYHAWKGWKGGRQAAAEVARALAELKTAGIAPPARLLEVGFGDGAVLKKAQALGYECAGLERDSAMIEGLKASGIDARVGSPEQFPHASFDLIAAFDVFEHVPMADLGPMLSKLKDLLRQNGRLVARFPNMASPFGLVNQYGDITHITGLSPGSLAQVGRIAGLDVIHVANAATVFEGDGAIRRIGKAMAFASRALIELLLSFAYYGKRTPLSPSVIVVMRRRD